MVSKEHKLIFLVPPKTASTSVFNTIGEYGIERDVVPPSPGQPTIHLKLSEIKRIFEIPSFEGYTIIQIVRNPYYRMVSSYYQQLRTMPKDDYLDIEFRNMSFSQYVHHLYDAKNSDNFIRNFYGDNDFVETQISEGKTWGGLRFFDNQVDWNDLNENVNYFKLENISNDFSPVSNLIGIDIPQLNSINVNPTEVDYDELLTDDLKIIIRELFDKDFESFSY
jgi:hypothetical protein